MNPLTRNPHGVLQQLNVSNTTMGRLVQLLQQWATQHPGSLLLTEQSLLDWQPSELEKRLEAEHENAESDGLGHGSQLNVERWAAAEALEQTAAQQPIQQGLNPANLASPGFALLISDGFCLLLQGAIAEDAAPGLERLGHCSPIQEDLGLTQAFASHSHRQALEARWEQGQGEQGIAQALPSEAARETAQETAPTTTPSPRPSSQVSPQEITLGLTFELGAIASFAEKLLAQPMAAESQLALRNWLAHPPKANRPEQQSRFTLLLLQQLTHGDGLDAQEQTQTHQKAQGTASHGTGSRQPRHNKPPQAPAHGATTLVKAAQPSALQRPTGQPDAYIGQGKPASVPQLPAEDSDDATALASIELKPTELNNAVATARIQELTQELQQAWEVAHGAEQAKAEFLAMMSHELRTPLTCVIGMSATMLRWSFGDLSDRQREYLQTIYDSGEHLLQLIESILDFSHAESGQARLQMRHVSLSRLVSYCLQLFQEAADQNGIHLRASVQLTPTEDEFVADPQRLRQILINLLDNAIKFTPAGGEVSLQVQRQGDGILFEVSDTGIGIEPVQQSLLFQKFQQLEASHRRRYQGSGLGLALTKHQVDLHQGTIELESLPGKGSTFRVWLPAQHLPAPLSADKPQGTVVLLEDDEQSAALICELLTASGFKVVWLVESSTALEQIMELQPLAAIVDLEIQGGSGDEIIRHIRQGALEHPPKMIALSSFEGNEAEFPRPDDPVVRADAYLFRPIQPKAFVSRLQSLILDEVAV